MFQFERISVNQILTFSEVISNLSLLRLDLVKAKYLKKAQNFDETIEILKELALVKINNNNIVLTNNYRSFLNDLIKSKHRRQITQEFILKNILKSEHSFSDHINEYLSYFQMTNHQYEFTPNTVLRLKYKGIRNFLMDLEFIYFDNDKNKYLIVDTYLPIFAIFKDSQLLSIDDFLIIRQKKEKIGMEAELQTIIYEKNRLSHIPSLVKDIKHISAKDLEAGYDIKSFECELDKVGNPITRYVEVKAVSSWDYKFYWTKNEIEKAKFYNNQYYLYLLPVNSREKFDFDAIKIICDPYSNIFKKEKEWICTEELLSYSLAPQEKNNK